jgi:hypothetical protein
MASRLLVNTCVVSEHRVILNWTILKVDNEEISVNNYYFNSVKPRLAGGLTGETTGRLVSAYIGHDKGSLDCVDIHLSLCLVINSFGHFLKYFVEITTQVVNARGISIEASSAYSGDSELESSASSEMPYQMFVEPLARERNKKDKLFNDIIRFFVSHHFSIDQSEMNSARKLVLLLRDILWYVDGHHHVFKERALAIPSIFTCFTLYNTPQLSKHRKRLTSNISAEQLESFALDISQVLHCSMWEKPKWIDLKPHVLSLSESLSFYAEYLHKKNKRIKINHELSHPVRELSENLKLKFVAASSIITSSLADIDDLLKDKSEYSFESLTHILPTNAVQKHRLMDTLLSNGLPYPCIILIYSPGSNIGNLVFAWRVPDNVKIELIFERSQSVVEEIRKLIPVFQTRSMKSAWLKKFPQPSSQHCSDIFTKI